MDKTEQSHEETGHVDEAAAGQFRGDLDPGPAWEEVAAGRFMPRRIKGSCIGRALG